VIAARHTVRLTAIALTALALGACSPGAPKGVDKTELDFAINEAIGDPATCVLIARGDEVVYRFGSNVTCGRKLPACDGAAVREVKDLLPSAPKAGAARMTASCSSTADGSRSVAWAAGPIAGREDLTYAAVMEGTATPPGLVVADKLDGAFARAGLQPKS
jgi:hypothetical protein